MASKPDTRQHVAIIAAYGTPAQRAQRTVPIPEGVTFDAMVAAARETYGVGSELTVFGPFVHGARNAPQAVTL